MEIITGNLFFIGLLLLSEAIDPFTGSDLVCFFLLMGMWTSKQNSLHHFIWILNLEKRFWSSVIFSGFLRNSSFWGHHIRICKKKTAVTPFPWLTSIEFSLKIKCRSHKIDNCYKLSPRESVTHPFRPSLAPPLFVREKSLNITPATFTLKRFLHQLFLLIWSVLKLFDLPVWSLLCAAWLLPCFIVPSKHQIRSTFCKEIRKKNWLFALAVFGLSHAEKADIGSYLICKRCISVHELTSNELSLCASDCEKLRSGLPLRR